MKRRFTVTRSRVRMFGARRLAATASNPVSGDLRKHDTPVRNQGQSNECTGYSWSGLFDFVRAKKLGLPGSAVKSTSPSFIYWCERVIDGNTNVDEGSQMHEGGQVLSLYGFCLEKYCKSPRPEMVFKKPSVLAFANALLYRNSTMVAVDSIDEMKTCITQGYPFVLGIDVPEALMNMGSTGKMSEADWNTEIVGGHALLCVGYDEYGLIIRNSWGVEFGDKGYFYLPWNHVDAKAFDCYTIR